MRNPMKPLHIPKSKRIPGLVVYCLKCKTNVYEKCKETGNVLQSCPFGNKHRFKIYRHVPGTANRRITKTFETRNLDEAIREAIKFKESLKQNNVQQQNIEAVQNSHHASTPLQLNTETTENHAAIMPLLTETMARHISYLSGDENIPSFQRRARSAEYVKEVERCYLRFIDCLKRSRYAPASLETGGISKEMIGVYYAEMQEKLKYSARSINKNIGFLSALFVWVIKEGIDVKNPFAAVVRKPEYHNPQAITKEEFEAFIKVIAPENGIHPREGIKRHRNIYRKYLVPGYRLFLYTGRRREEVINMRFSDIVKDRAGNPIMIEVPDRKVNAIQGRTEKNKKINHVPITAQLLQLLNELGYEKYKDTDKFILTPEIKIKRNKMMAENLSRAFSHYFKLVSDRNLSMKSIRKAYLTSVNLYTGGNAKIVSGHSGNAVLEAHYLDKEFIAKSLRNFEVFGNEAERNSELNAIRKNHNEREISLEK